VPGDAGDKGDLQQLNSRRRGHIYMRYDVESPDTLMGLPISGDFILVNEEGDPYFDKGADLFVRTFVAERGVPEPLHINTNNIYALDFYGKDKRDAKLPDLDRRFWLLGRLRGARISKSPGDIRMSIEVLAWSYVSEDILDARLKQAMPELVKFVTAAFQTVIPEAGAQSALPNKADVEAVAGEIKLPPAFQGPPPPGEDEPYHGDDEPDPSNSPEEDGPEEEEEYSPFSDSNDEEDVAEKDNSKETETDG
jgi:hypothetical protein